MSTIELLNQVKQLPPREQLILAEKILTGLVDRIPPQQPQDTELPVQAVRHELFATEEERIAGLHAGMAWVSEDFDEPLPDDFWLGVK